jgi:hypothetical protein
VTGGIRYFKYDAYAIGGTDTPLFGGGLTRTPYPLIQFDPSRIRSGNTSADGVVWKANTSYKFSKDLLVYATYSTGYRTGNVNRVAPCTFSPGMCRRGRTCVPIPANCSTSPTRPTMPKSASAPRCSTSGCNSRQAIISTGRTSRWIPRP